MRRSEAARGAGLGRRVAAGLVGLSLAAWTPVAAAAPGEGSEGPPVQRPSTRAPAPAVEDGAGQDSVVVEGPAPAPAEPASPVGPATAEPAPTAEPVAAAEPGSAAEAAPAPAPSPTAGGLPSYAEAPPVATTLTTDPGATPGDEPEADIGREVPPDGVGLLTTGGLSLAASAVLYAGTGVLARADNELWHASLAAGIVATVSSAVFIGIGVPRHRKYRAWLADQPDADAVPPQGSGLVLAGSGFMVAGATISVAGTVMTAFSCFETFGPCERSPLGPIALGTGIGSLALATGLMVAGVRRNKRFHRWRRSFAAQLDPGVAPVRGGATLVLSGRF